MATTVSYADLQNRIIGLGIATAVTGILAGILLQFTRRIRNMPSYFKSNFSIFYGNFIFYYRQFSQARDSHCAILYLFINPINPSSRLGYITWGQCWSQSMFTSFIYWHLYNHTVHSLI